MNLEDPYDFASIVPVTLMMPVNADVVLPFDTMVTTNY